MGLHLHTGRLKLFTVMIWFREHTISMFLISDNNIYNKTTVVPYSLYVFNYIEGNFEGVREVEVWTNGLTSQFKNKLISGFIGKTLPDHFDFHLTWNFSATKHEKG